MVHLQEYPGRQVVGPRKSRPPHCALGRAYGAGLGKPKVGRTGLGGCGMGLYPPFGGRGTKVGVLVLHGALLVVVGPLLVVEGEEEVEDLVGEALLVELGDEVLPEEVLPEEVLELELLELEVEVEVVVVGAEQVLPTAPVT